MKRELYEEWTAALRSGNYKQGKYTLKNKSGEFCCLGVLCELMGLERRSIPHADYTMAYWYEGNSYVNSLSPTGIYGKGPPALVDVLGLGVKASIPGTEDKESIEGQLMEANDTYEKKFVEIADMLDSFVARGELELT